MSARQQVTSDPALIERIRNIFLHHEPRVTIDDAAQMLGWSPAQMKAAISGGDIEVLGTCSGKVIELRELAGQALNQWSLATIEAALGRDASLILPPALRTRKLTVRLPRYQIEALRVLAADGGEAVDTFLDRMFQELADTEKERLAPVIPGLAEAIAWPEVTETARPC
jgi:hypothetical protein